MEFINRRFTPTESDLKDLGFIKDSKVKNEYDLAIHRTYIVYDANYDNWAIEPENAISSIRIFPKVKSDIENMINLLTND